MNPRLENSARDATAACRQCRGSGRSATISSTEVPSWHRCQMSWPRTLARTVLPVTGECRMTVSSWVESMTAGSCFHVHLSIPVSVIRVRRAGSTVTKPCLTNRWTSGAPVT